MDLSTIEVNKNVILYHDWQINDQATTSWTVQINTVPFIPDYMVIRAISYLPRNDDTIGSYTLYSDIIGDDIGFFSVDSNDGGVNNVQAPVFNHPIYFKLNKPINGSYTFIPRGPSQDASAIQGYMVLAIDFIRFKSEKPQKTY